MGLVELFRYPKLKMVWGKRRGQPFSLSRAKVLKSFNLPPGINNKFSFALIGLFYFFFFLRKYSKKYRPIHGLTRPQSAHPPPPTPAEKHTTDSTAHTETHSTAEAETHNKRTTREQEQQHTEEQRVSTDNNTQHTQY